ncbi:MAG: hypothetical protein KDA68_13490 [Planctomycetaceae bacterium]|nr:hypothetical protein [Planctomycetaceae bacterium]
MSSQGIALLDSAQRREVTWRGAFALFSRRMNRDARDWKFHLLIACSMLFLLAQATAMAIPALNRAPAVGLIFLRVWGKVGLFFIIVLGISYFVQLLAEEKEQGTLGLVKLTGIGPLGILIGLFGSRLTQALVIFTLQLPFVVWSVTLGGVTFHQAVALFVTLLSTLFLAGNLALFASVVCSNAATASGACFLILVGLSLGYGSCFLLQAAISNGTLVFSGAPLVGSMCDSIISNVQLISPYHRLGSILVTGYSDPLINPQVVASLILGCSLFRLSWRRFEKFTNQTEPVLPARNIKLTIRKEKGTRKSQRCWNNPYVWREFQFSGKGLKGVAGGILIVAGLAILLQLGLPLILERVGYLEYEIPQMMDGAWIAWMFVTGTLSAVLPFALIGGALTNELKGQTLSTLFLVSRRPDQILRNLILGRFLMVAQLPVWLALGMFFIWIGDPSRRISPYLDGWLIHAVLALLIILLWVYASIFFGVAAMRLDFIKSQILKGLVVIAVMNFGPVLIMLLVALLRAMFFEDRDSVFGLLISTMVICLGMSIPILVAIWNSTIDAIRQRMEEG